MNELRVLVHAPRGRDAAVVQGVLEHQGIAAHVCAGDDDLVECLEQGAASMILTEEALAELFANERLARWLQRQPPWSDFPFIVLATKHEGRRADEAFQTLRGLGNLVVLERPLNAETLASAAESAVRARRRQYAAREHLQELDRTRGELQNLNAELEDRIRTRTRELASANDRLMKEINERERAQAALTQVQKMEAIGRLTGGIAHDFNNLLHVVNMNLELVSLYAKEEKVKPVVERAKSASRRGARLTNQLLSFARSQSLLPKLTHVNQLLNGMRDLLESSVGSGIAVEYELCEEDATVVLDPGQLEMAVLNLAVNSKDAMPEERAPEALHRHPLLRHRRARPAGRRLRAGDGDRQRHRHPTQRAAQGVRPLLHHQAGGQRHRAGPEPGVRLRAPVGRHGARAQRRGTGYDGGNAVPAG